MMTAMLRTTCSNRQISKEFRRRLVNLDRIKLLDQIPDSIEVRVRRRSAMASLSVSNAVYQYQKISTPPAKRNDLVTDNLTQTSDDFDQFKNRKRKMIASLRTGSSTSLYYAQTVASMLLTSRHFKLNVNEKSEFGKETITSLLSKMGYLLESSPVLKDQFDEYLESHPRAKKQFENETDRGENEPSEQDGDNDGAD